MRSEVRARHVENLSCSPGSGVLCSNRARNVRPSARTKQEGGLGLFPCAALPAFRVAAKIVMSLLQTPAVPRLGKAPG